MLNERAPLGLVGMGESVLSADQFGRTPQPEAHFSDTIQKQRTNSNMADYTPAISNENKYFLRMPVNANDRPVF